MVKLSGTPCPRPEPDLICETVEIACSNRRARYDSREAEKQEPPPEQPDISPDIASASQAETPIETATLANQQADIASANQPPPAAPPKRPAPPLTCQPAANYPFRYVTKCDRPTPIPNPAGWGDPIGCSNCGATFGNTEACARSEASQRAKVGAHQ